MQGKASPRLGLAIVKAAWSVRDAIGEVQGWHQRCVQVSEPASGTARGLPGLDRKSNRRLEIDDSVRPALRDKHYLARVLDEFARVNAGLAQPLQLPPCGPVERRLVARLVQALALALGARVRGTGQRVRRRGSRLPRKARWGRGGDEPPGSDAMSELQLEDLATLCAIPRSPSGPFGGNSRRCPSIVVHHSSS